MNKKIFNKLQEMFKTSPQLMRDKNSLKQAISVTFEVEVGDIEFTNINDVVDIIDNAVLSNYFSNVWQPKTKKYKYSGLSIIDEINSLHPLEVLDLGCGYNEFKGKINNLIGVDPYNSKADFTSRIVDFNPGKQFDVVICLGSINFGTVDRVFAELEKAVSLTKTNGLLFFRANPGEQHEAPESRWIDFFDWNPGFIINAANELGCEVLTLQQDVGNRYYFVLKVK